MKTIDLCDYTKIKRASVNSEQIGLILQIALASLVQFVNLFNLFPNCTETMAFYITGLDTVHQILAILEQEDQSFHI